MRGALIWTFLLAVSTAILALIWTAPVVFDGEPDLCATCMGWEAQRLAMTVGIAVAWVVIPVMLLMKPEARHDGYDGCESCNWRPVC